MNGKVSRSVAAWRQVTVRYGKTMAVAGVSLEVSRGSVYALLGRNGAGKSSLVRCLLGQQKPTAGVAELFGRDAWRSRAAAMARVGVVPEECDLPPAMDAHGLLAFCSRLYPHWEGADAARRLDRFKVPMSVAVSLLSKGQKRQLALTLALGHGPELLVLDDPTLGLDVVARKEFYEELVGELADRSTTVLITTHDLAGIEGIAERVGILRGGALLVDEELETLKGRFRRIHVGRQPTGMAAPLAADLVELQPVSITTRAAGLEAIVGAFDEQVVARFCQRHALGVTQAQAMTLEEIFIALVGEEREVAS
jgi:ABC-2 type transport system ATP-binding protein